MIVNLLPQRLKLTTVYLEYHTGDNLEMFYCHHCRYPCFQYSGEIIQLLPGVGDFSPPIVFQCGNKECHHKYAVLGFIKPI